MAKKKKQKKNSELLMKRCNIKDSKKVNPFELKINKEKHQVLGRRQKKLIGLPTVAHKKSLLKRKNTILQEYIYRNKQNVFSDKRLHIERRKAVQVMHQNLRESDKYQLGEDVELTHRGQSLSKIEKMEEPFSDSDDEQLSPIFVESAHFGGFLTEKKTEEPVKSRQELIKEIIADSKNRKYEKQSIREAGIEMTEKLDSEWKGIQHLVAKGIQKKAAENQTKYINSYDMIVKQLIHEKRGSVSNPTKRLEEMETQEQERKRKLEMDREGRMNMVSYVESEKISQNSDDSVSILSTIAIVSDKMDKENDSGIAVAMTNESKGDHEPHIPATLEKFIEIISNHSKDELNSFIGQVTTNNRSKLDSLGVFFNMIMEYACYIVDDENSDITILNVLIPHLYELAEMSPKVAAHYLLQILKNAEEQFDEKYKKVQFPKLSTLIVLKLCCILFPTSDFRHLVGSPAMLFIARLLVECHIFTVRDILCGLFISNLALECVSYSKRYFPEAINFLMRLLSLSMHENDIVHHCCPPFDNFKLDISVLETDVPDMINKLKLSDLRNSNQKLDNTLKLQLINFTTELLLRFMDLYKELPSYTEIFSSVLNICKNSCNRTYPKLITYKIKNITTLIESAEPKQYLSLPERPFKCLRFLEPKIEENFDGRKAHKGNKQHLEKEKLRHKFKREMKGAVREIRHDNYFLADHWLKEQAEKDRERKEKVKQLYQELANQEGDIKALKRKKF